MKTDTEFPFEKLPKWAREHLALLEMRTKEAEAKLQALFPDARTNTYWNEGFSQKRPLPPNARIRFMLGSDEFDFVEVGINNRNYLEISGADTISITPQASNLVMVRLARVKPISKGG